MGDSTQALGSLYLNLYTQKKSKNYYMIQLTQMCILGAPTAWDP